MSVYAPVPAFADRQPHPRALFLIVAGHAALLAAVMTARPEIAREVFRPITVQLIPDDTTPPENPPPPQPKQQPRSVIDHPTTVVPIPQPSQPALDTTPLPLPKLDPGPIIDPGPPATSVRPAEPVRVGPRFVTPESEIRPPYPTSKLREGEEAVLKLRLSIDQRGRVVGVEAVGPADPAFLEAARRHLIAHWRYRPATEDGRPVATSTVITLRFQLDD
jgi:protein TonB